MFADMPLTNPQPVTDSFDGTIGLVGVYSISPPPTLVDCSVYDFISTDPTVITDPSFCVDPIPYDLFPIDISTDPTVITDPYFIVDPIPYDLFPIDISIDPTVITDPYPVDPIPYDLFPIDVTLDSSETDSISTDSSLFILSVAYDSIASGLTFDPSLVIGPIAFFRTTADITITSSTEIPVFPDETIINPLASTSLFTLLNITDPSAGHTPSNQGVLITQSDDATFTSINKSVLAKTKRLD